MDIKTFRASSMHEALALVRSELGPDAAVLHTREVERRRFFGLVRGEREIEVTASADVHVPSRLPERVAPTPPAAPPMSNVPSMMPPMPEPAPLPEPETDGATRIDWRNEYGAATNEPSNARAASHGALQQEFEQFNARIQGQLESLHAKLEGLYHRGDRGTSEALPDTLFRCFTELIEADFSEDTARRLVEEVRANASADDLADPVLVEKRMSGLIASRLNIGGPIHFAPGERKVVALVGPTGVGKTTTIAKLAAHYRLREKRRVGFITVDTYRIAAVEQLRTYAEIIDLPMEVVSTPSEMRQAVDRLGDQELILIDTAGRSPQDEIKIRELRALLNEARTDQVMLVMSAGAGAKTLKRTAEQFAVVGTDGLIVTKLDEATALGHLYSVLQSADLPLHYWTTGQNVPDDIETAERDRAARLLMAIDSVAQVF